MINAKLYKYSVGISELSKTCSCNQPVTVNYSRLIPVGLHLPYGLQYKVIYAFIQLTNFLVYVVPFQDIQH